MLIYINTLYNYLYKKVKVLVTVCRPTNSNHSTMETTMTSNNIYILENLSKITVNKFYVDRYIKSRRLLLNSIYTI